jgi:hypothetical protein
MRDTFTKYLKRGVSFWRLTFGLAAGALLAFIWQLACFTTGVEQESALYRYILSNLISKPEPVSTICLVDAAKGLFADRPEFKNLNTEQFVEKVLPSLEAANPALIGVVLDSVSFDRRKMSTTFDKLDSRIVVGVPVSLDEPSINADKQVNAGAADESSARDSKQPVAISHLLFKTPKGYLTYRLPARIDKVNSLNPFSVEVVSKYDELLHRPEQSRRQPLMLATCKQKVWRA